MVRLDLLLDPAVRRVMASLVAALASRGLWREPRLGLPIEDVDLRHAWVADLRTEARDDTAHLRRLLEDERFGRKPLDLADEEAEAILRACSVVRLRLRETGLSRLADEELEAGEIPMARLPAEERRIYACYLFLAGLQTILIARLDPAAGAGDEDEPGGNDE